MGDHTCVSFEIGGKLPKSLVEELVAAANSDGLGTDWNDSDFTLEGLEKREPQTSLALTGTEINYANCDALEDFCQENALLYCKLWDAGGGFPAGGEIRDLTCMIDGTDVLEFSVSGTGGDVFLNDREIRDLGSWEAVLARLDRLSAQMPAFEVVDG